MKNLLTAVATLALFVLCATELRAERPKLVVQTGHFGAVSAVAFSPDARLLASAGFDNTITLWSADTGDQLYSLKAHTNTVSSVVFSSDGTVLASGGWDGTARIWDPATGRLRQTIQASALAVDSVAISPDNTILATGSYDNSIKLWNIETGVMLRELTGHTGGVAAVAFAPDGKTLVSGSHDHSVRLWDVKTGRSRKKLSGHPVAIMGVAFSADGKQVASGGGGYNGRAVVIVWDVVTGEARHTFVTDDEWVSCVAFSPDGKSLIAGTNTRGHALHLWNLTTGKETGTLSTKADAVYAIAFSPDGKLFASGGSDNAISLREPGNWVEQRMLQGHVHSITAVAVSADGRQLASAGRTRDIKLWNLARTAPLRRIQGDADEVAALAFSPKSNLLTSGGHDSKVKIWDPVSGKELFILPGHTAPIRCVAFSPTGALLASGGDDNTVKIWNVDTGETSHTLTGHIDFVHAVAFSPDGKLLASASGDTTIKLWDVATGRELRTLKGHDNWVQAVVFNPDGGTLVSGSADKTIKVWNVSDGRELRTLRGHTDAVETVVLLPGGTKLASGGWDRAVKIWDLASGKELLTLAGHTDAVLSLALAHDGAILASGSMDTQIKLWDVAKADSLASLTALDDNDWAVVDSDGRFDASDDGMKLMHFVIDNESLELDQLKDGFWDPGLLAKVIGFNRRPLRDVSSLGEVKLSPLVAYEPFGVDRTKLAFKLINRGGGIGRVQVLVNNKELISDARGVNFDPAAVQAGITVDLTDAPFVRGQANEIRVVAWNESGRLRNRGARLPYVPSAGASKAPTELYAVVAGISEYASEKLRLQFAASDAADFSTALKLGANRLFGAARVHMKVLTSSDNPELSPTKDNIHNAFKEVINNAKETDVLVVYLSGHGMSLQRDGKDLYCYLTEEARTADADQLKHQALLDQWTITSEELHQWMTGKEGVKALKQVMILDTCAAGAAESILAAKGGGASDDEMRLEMKKLQEATGFHLLMGSASDRSSFENPRYGHGILTYALLRGMKGAALRGGEFVDVTNLFRYVEMKTRDFASEVGKFQQPQTAGLGGTSFDIGKLKLEDKEAIRLENPKTVILRPRLINPQEVGDTLNLETALAKRLRSESYAKGSMSAAGSSIYYEDADEIPGAIRPIGTYTVKSRTVFVTLKLHRDYTVVKTLHVEGAKNDIAALADKLTKVIAKAVSNLQP